MKNYQKIAFASLFFLIGFYSCQKEEVSFRNHDPRDAFQKVARFLNAPNLETQQQLILTFERKGVEEFLLADFLKSKGDMLRNTVSFEELDSLILENPMITIAYPSFAFHEETFEEHLNHIDYTVMLFDDPDEVDSLAAFNSSGQLVQISSTFNESHRYCVVKYDEAYIAVNPSTRKTYFGDDVSIRLFDFTPRDTVGNYLMYSAADLINSLFIEAGTYLYSGGEGGGGGSGDPCNLPCERDCYEKKDELHRVMWSSKECVKNFESGFHLPKVEMIAYYGIPRYNNGTVTVDLVAKDVYLNWKDMTTKFSDPLGLEIATWTEDLGNRWQVLWIERDYWNKVQSKFTLGFSVSFKVENTNISANAAWEIISMKQDKEIGRSIIEYCDKAKNEGETYKPFACGGPIGIGGFWFKEHIRN